MLEIVAFNVAIEKLLTL
uniref:Uncharacterized protein n=1 Tax=Anguilla anguilla TaxID=7936 RepID=A0A0E9W5U6_ANGAN